MWNAPEDEKDDILNISHYGVAEQCLAVKDATHAENVLRKDVCMMKGPFQQARRTAITFLVLGVMNGILVFIMQKSHSVLAITSFTIITICLLSFSVVYFILSRFYLKREQNKILPKEEKMDNPWQRE